MQSFGVENPNCWMVHVRICTLVHQSFLSVFLQPIDRMP